MGSPHVIVFIVQRKGVNGAKKTVIQPYYHHTMYGSMVAYILTPLLKALKSHPHLFQRRNRSKNDFFNFLLMTVSYNLTEGTRDSHSHIEDKIKDLGGISAAHGVTYIDISEIETRGPAYCIMSTEGYPKSFVQHRPYALQDYLTAYGENKKLVEDNDDLPNYSKAFNKLRRFNLSRSARCYAEACQIDMRILQRGDLEPIWSAMPPESEPERDEDDDTEVIVLPDRRVEDEESRVPSLVEISLEALRGHLASDAKAAEMALQLPPVLHDYLWQKLCISKRSKITDHLIPLSFAQLGNVQTLDLSFCGSLTDAALDAIAQSDSTKLMRALFLSDNSHVTSRGLNSVSEKLQHLGDLRAHRCSSVQAADLLPATKAIMSFSHGLVGCEMDIYIILAKGKSPFDNYGSSSQAELIRVMRHDWLYGLAALHYLFRAVDHPTPTWMDYGGGGYSAIPYGSHDQAKDTVLNYVQTTVDHFPGFFSVDGEKGIFGDVWALRRRLLTPASGGKHSRLRLDPAGGPPSGSIVIDLRERNETGGIKYCFMATRDPFLGVCSDVATMVPMSAQDYASKFYPAEGPNLPVWSGPRSSEAIQQMQDSVGELVAKLADYSLMTIEDLKSITYTGAFFVP
eukprot:TRINITY_DN13512_c0_g1_i1.p1 TRINITY_DN13512_c0_g1~~TRINITY_DN13512_c0_g1_i1.p1  ORF type:complete len:626 (-),score=80.30 TRINITY_DN13512_c0_g1_i1:182-2059(-)